MQSAKKHLPKSTVKNTVKDPKPEYYTEALFHLKVIGRYLRKFSIKHINAGTHPSATTWSIQIYKDLLAASRYVDFDSFSLNECLGANILKDIHQCIGKLFPTVVHTL